jgi:hypothetical protein
LWWAANSKQRKMVGIIEDKQPWRFGFDAVAHSDEQVFAIQLARQS